MTQAGPALPVMPVTDRAADGGPALRVAVVSDGRPTEGGPSRPVIVVTDNRPTQGNEPLPIVLATGAQATRILAGPAMPIVIVSGSLNTNTPPANTVLPVISGTLNLGQLLTTTNGTWTGTAPIVYTYQWKRGGVAIGGATNNTYTTVLADVGTTITVEVTATNASGSASATSAGVVIFTPTSISGLQLWLKADALALNNNDPVSSWTDSSGNANNAVQASGTLQPLYITNQINGKPIVRGDGSNDYLQTGSNIALTGDFTIWWVAKITDLTAARAYYGRSASGNPLIDQLNTTTLRLRNDAGTLVSITHVAILTTTYYLVEVMRSGANVTRYVNGAVDGTQTLAGTITYNQVLIRDTTSTPMKGDVAETGIYTTALDATQRGNLETYLNAKYVLF